VAAPSALFAGSREESADWGESVSGSRSRRKRRLRVRFVVQWIASERAKRSVVPVSFWYLSLVGAAILLFYAIHRRDPIFTLAYLPNGFIYARNLYLTRRKPR
jgi:hypothetical protein